MKKIFTLLSLFCMISFTTVVIGQQAPNPGFETWTSSTACTSWNSASQPPILNGTYAQSTDAHSGTYSIEMATITLGLSIPGIATLGTVDLATQSVTGGVPFTATPSNLQGYFKYTPVGADSGIVVVVLYKNTDTLATGAFVASTLTSTWQLFDIPLDYSTTITGSPTTMNIVMLSSAYNPQVGSSLKIDDLNFIYNPLNVTENKSNDMISVYPNPATENISIDLSKFNSPSSINIYNSLGELVSKSENCSNNNNISVNHLSNGVYSVEVLNNNQKSIKKLIIEK